MHNNKQAGILNALLIPVIVLSMLVAGLSVFGAWSYMKYKDYKNNVDQKIAAAVSDAKLAQEKELATKFAEQEKQPTRKFTSPAELGSVSVMYPKTWNVYVDKGGAGGLYEAYLNPVYVTPVSEHHPDALRMTIQTRSYTQKITELEPKIKKGDLKSSPIKLKNGDGIRLDGKLDETSEGSMILFPLRDKTVQIYTESKEFLPDFNNIIIPDLTYIP